jgi:hypothetical protein
MTTKRRTNNTNCIHHALNSSTTEKFLLHDDLRIMDSNEGNIISFFGDNWRMIVHSKQKKW